MIPGTVSTWNHFVWKYCGDICHSENYRAYAITVIPKSAFKNTSMLFMSKRQSTLCSKAGTQCNYFGSQKELKSVNTAAEPCDGFLMFSEYWPWDPAASYTLLYIIIYICSWFGEKRPKCPLKCSVYTRVNRFVRLTYLGHIHAPLLYMRCIIICSITFQFNWPFTSYKSKNMNEWNWIRSWLTVEMRIVKTEQGRFPFIFPLDYRPKILIDKG